jgi:hypothetical protein
VECLFFTDTTLRSFRLCRVSVCVHKISSIKLQSIVDVISDWITKAVKWLQDARRDFFPLAWARKENISMSPRRWDLWLALNIKHFCWQFISLFCCRDDGENVAVMLAESIRVFLYETHFGDDPPRKDCVTPTRYDNVFVFCFCLPRKPTPWGCDMGHARQISILRARQAASPRLKNIF